MTISYERYKDKDYSFPIWSTLIFYHRLVNSPKFNYDKSHYWGPDYPKDMWNPSTSQKFEAHQNYCEIGFQSHIFYFFILNF